MSATLGVEHYERLFTATTALATAPDLESFAQILLARALEFSAAQHAVFILEQDGAWGVYAATHRAPPSFQIYPATPLSASAEQNLLWVKPVLEAIRTRRTHVERAAEHLHPPLPEDATAPPRPDILCTPLLCDGRVLAVLYLEKRPDLYAEAYDKAHDGAYVEAYDGAEEARFSSRAPFAELTVQLIARLVQQAAPRLHSLLEMGRLAELVQLRREMTDALRASEERFRSIFNSSPVLIFMTDLQGRLLMVNDYWLQALGYSRVEVVSRPLGEFCTEYGRTLLMQQIQPAPLAGHQYENLPIQFVRRNGALLDALVSGVILPSEIDGYSQSLSFAIDMTAHRQAEQELDRYRRRLEELVRERTHELSAANRQLEQDILRRKAAEAQLLRSQQFLQATIDALSEKLAILDADGAIVALNSSWHDHTAPPLEASDAPPVQYPPEQAAYWEGFQIGADYLTALRGAARPSQTRHRLVDPSVIAQVAQGLNDLNAGAQHFFHVLYRLHADSPAPDAGDPNGGENWYSLRAIRFQSGGETYIAVAHDDVTDRKAAEQALLEAAAVNERHRLARELHDSVTQALYSMALFVDATRLALSAGQVERASNNLVELRAMSRGAMENMRALIFELHPPELAEIGLVGALREYLKNYQHRTQIGVGFQISGEERAMPVRVESELYRVAQEALTNCFKHARADHVDVQLAYGDAGLHLTIADNGQGFQVDLARLGGGMGIRGMMERVHSIGGQFKVDSRPDHGATVRVDMTYTDLVAVATTVWPPVADTDNSDRKAGIYE